MTSDSKSADEIDVNYRAESGEVAAQVYLGWAYGKFGEYDYRPDLAERWLRAAARSGDLSGLRGLARFYFDENRIELVETVQSLVELNDPVGYFFKGHMLASGRGGAAISRQEALKCFSKAEALGHIPSAIDAIKMKSRYPLFHPTLAIKLMHLVFRQFVLAIRNRNDPRIFR